MDKISKNINIAVSCDNQFNNYESFRDNLNNFITEFKKGISIFTNYKHQLMSKYIEEYRYTLTMINDNNISCIDGLLAFWDGNDGKTHDIINYMVDHNKRLKIVFVKGD